MEFYVAAELGMSVGRLRSEMPNEEFVRWAVYFARKAQRQEVARGSR